MARQTGKAVKKFAAVMAYKRKMQDAEGAAFIEWNKTDIVLI